MSEGELKRIIKDKRQRFQRLKSESKKISEKVCCNVVLSELDDYERKVDEAKKEFLAIYPEEELGGTLQRWIQSLEELLVVEEKTAKRIGATLRPDKYRLLRTLKWFVKYFVDSEG